MDQFAQKYVEEATEILAKLEEYILLVENDPTNKEYINEIFRLMHTLKGGGAMFGFGRITDVTHELESIYDYIRNGKAAITKELLDASLNIIDYVKEIISQNNEVDEFEHKEKVDDLASLKEKFKNFSKNANNSTKNTQEKPSTKKETVQKNTAENKKTKEEKTEIKVEKSKEVVAKKETIEKKEEIKENIKKETPEKKEEKKESVKKEIKVEEKKKDNINKTTPVEIKQQEISSSKGVKTYKVFFKPDKDILKNGTDPLLLIRELSELGISKVFAITDFVPNLEDVNYTDFYLCWVVLVVLDDKNLIDDVFIFVEDEAVIEVEELFDGNAFNDAKFMENFKDFSEALIAQTQKHCIKLLSDENPDFSGEEETVIIDNTESEHVEVKHKEKFEEVIEKQYIEEEVTSNKNVESKIESNSKEDSDVEIKTKQELLDEKIEELQKVTSDQQTEQTKEVEVELSDNGDDNAEEENEFVLKTSTDIATNFTDKSTTISSLRISAEKVDTLMNLVSELITTQARLNVYIEDDENPELEAITENIQKLSRQLRDIAFDFSMIPLHSVVIRFQRLVRDLSSQLNKDVEFVTEGTSTELDKRIIENLIDPILHLLRNSLDHGIETKQERSKAGKKSKAQVYLKAFYSGTNVFIQVGDDGRGINVEKIKEKAIAKGILNENTKYTNDEILNTIFEPGFSTSTQVSELSGRGVGLDVVKRKVSELRGEVKVTSNLGKGTLFTIKLPLTLSIIDGLLVIIGTTRYVIPMNIVEKIYAITKEDLKQSHYNILILDKKQIPYYHLREEFNETSEPPEIEQVIVIKHEEKHIAIIVDKIIGEYQAVLKTLGKLYNDQQIFSGGTILGDGSVALVMDVRKIIDKYSIKI